MTRAGEVVAALEAAADPSFLADLGPKYGIHTDRALGVRMTDVKAIAKPLGTDHELAEELWATGVHEARIVASLVGDAARLTPTSMDAWCRDFDTWAIVDAVCSNLFDRSPHAWTMLERWAARKPEMQRRAGFALLWCLANHDRTAPDDAFRGALPLIERHAGDGRHLVDKAVSMALRAIGKRRPGVRADAVAVAERLAARDDPAARRIGREALRALAQA